MKNFINKIWDHSNPIFIKELRQGLHGKQFYILIWSFLTVLLLSYLMVMPEHGVSYSERINTGSTLAGVITAIVGIVIFGIIPIGLSSRFISDAEEDSLNLIYTTTIKPRSIVLGKFLAGFTNVLVITSVAFPFFAISYFLGGVDLLNVLYMVGFLLFISMPLLAFGIFNGVLPGRKSFKRIRITLLVIFLIFVGTGILESIGFMRGSVNEELPYIFATLVTLSIFGTGLLLFASINFIAPEASNRSYPLRVFILCSSIISLLIVFIGTSLVTTEKDAFLGVWSLVEMGTILFCFVVFVNGPSEISSRIKSEIPQSRFSAFIKYPLTHGGISGLWFSVIKAVVVVSTILIIGTLYKLRDFKLDDEFIQSFIGTIMYTFAFTGFGYIGFHYLVKRKFPKSKPLIVGALLLSISIVTNIMIVNFTGAGRELFGLSPIGLFDWGKSARITSLTISCLLAGIVLLWLILKLPSEIRKHQPVRENIPNEDLLENE